MHKTRAYDRRVEFTLFSPENRRAICAMLPDAMIHQIDQLWAVNSHLLGLGEWELNKDAMRAGRPLSPQDHLLRAQFWIEYDKQQMNPDAHYPNLNMSRVIGRAISKETFYRHIITDPHKLAFILTPPLDYREALEIALNAATSKLIEILNVSLLGEDGKVDKDFTLKLARIIESTYRNMRASATGKFTRDRNPGAKHPGAEIRDDALKRAAQRIPTAETKEEKIARLKEENAKLKSKSDLTPRDGNSE